MFVGDATVVAGVGIPHAELVALTEKYFGHLPPTQNKIKKAVSKYVGGLKLVEEMPISSDHASGTVNIVPLTHLMIAFESCSFYGDEQFVASLLAVLMGSGKSFSDGGPGKGMYSRLNRDVINQHGWVEQAQAACLAFPDSGLFGIYANAGPEHIEDLFEVVTVALTKMATTYIGKEEFNRAKNQLKANLSFTLETRMFVLEDLVRQMTVYNKRHTVQEINEKIDALTAQDVRNYASKILLSSKPTVVVYGKPESINKITQKKVDDMTKHIRSKIR